MIPDKVKQVLKKQHYRIVGKHSAVQICRWTKSAIKGGEVCYKEKFYGIKSHQCCQMTPAVMWCPNKCLHCWRAIELTLGDKLDKKKVDSPSEIIDNCIEEQKKLLEGFKINPETKHKTLSKADMKKWLEAQEPMQFAISLSGEPTIYPYIGELIVELRKRGKTSFLVTNGVYPKKLKELIDKKQLPTQLYISVNASNKKLYDEFHRSSDKSAWKKLNESLELMEKLRGKTRTIFRMNLVRELNMLPEHVKEYAELIKKSKPLFIEVKGFMSVGYSRERLGYDKMPTEKEMEDFIKILVDELKKLKQDYKLLDKHERSRAYVLGKDKRELKIKRV